jgi:hypothetical protein
VIVPAAMNVEATLEQLHKQPPPSWFDKDCKKELVSVGDDRFHQAGMPRITDEFVRGYVFALYVVKNMMPGTVDPKAAFG